MLKFPRIVPYFVTNSDHSYSVIAKVEANNKFDDVGLCTVEQTVTDVTDVAKTRRACAFTERQSL